MVDYTPAVHVCYVSDLEENEMKEMDFISGTKVLMIKQNNVISAIGNKCPHYGGPLIEGVLGRGRVRCPWHGACFNIETGDIEDFPGLDSIPCYKVEVSLSGAVRVRAKLSELSDHKRIKPFSPRNPNDLRVFIVVGGGSAGAKCVETLRQEHFTGRILMIGREPYLPYQKTSISKKPLDIVSIADLEYRTESFYKERDIETILGVDVVSINWKDEKRVYCNNDMSYAYDKVFIATGVRPIMPEIQGIELKNITSIFDFDTCMEVLKTISIVSDVVILGSSFRALELATGFYPRASSVTIIGITKFPYSDLLGDEIAVNVEKLYIEFGIRFISSTTIQRIEGNENDEVNKVILSDGTELNCNLLFISIGMIPNTEFLKDSGITMNEHGYVNTDAFGMTNIPDIYAGGDIANSPIFSNGNQLQNVNFLKTAQYHGHIAAINMASLDPLDKIEYRVVPQYFTSILGKFLVIAGFGKYVDILVEGDPTVLKFIAYYFDKDDYVVYVAGIGYDHLVGQFAELLYQNKRLNRCDILGAHETTDWTQMLKTRPRC